MRFCLLAFVLCLPSIALADCAEQTSLDFRDCGPGDRWLIIDHRDGDRDYVLSTIAAAPEGQIVASGWFIEEGTEHAFTSVFRPDTGVSLYDWSRFGDSSRVTHSAVSREGGVYRMFRISVAGQEYVHFINQQLGTETARQGTFTELTVVDEYTYPTRMREVHALWWDNYGLNLIAGLDDGATHHAYVQPDGSIDQFVGISDGAPLNGLSAAFNYRSLIAIGQPDDIQIYFGPSLNGAENLSSVLDWPQGQDHLVAGAPDCHDGAQMLFSPHRDLAPDEHPTMADIGPGQPALHYLTPDGTLQTRAPIEPIFDNDGQPVQFLPEGMAYVTCDLYVAWGAVLFQRGTSYPIVLFLDANGQRTAGLSWIREETEGGIFHVGMIDAGTGALVVAGRMRDGALLMARYVF